MGDSYFHRKVFNRMSRAKSQTSSIAGIDRNTKNSNSKQGEKITHTCKSMSVNFESKNSKYTNETIESTEQSKIEIDCFDRQQSEPKIVSNISNIIDEKAEELSEDIRITQDMFSETESSSTRSLSDKTMINEAKNSVERDKKLSNDTNTSGPSVDESRTPKKKVPDNETINALEIDGCSSSELHTIIDSAASKMTETTATSTFAQNNNCDDKKREKIGSGGVNGSERNNQNHGGTSGCNIKGNENMNLIKSDRSTQRKRLQGTSKAIILFRRAASTLTNLTTIDRSSSNDLAVAEGTSSTSQIGLFRLTNKNSANSGQKQEIPQFIVPKINTLRSPLVCRIKSIDGALMREVYINRYELGQHLIDSLKVSAGICDSKNFGLKMAKTIDEQDDLRGHWIILNESVFKQIKNKCDQIQMPKLICKQINRNGDIKEENESDETTNTNNKQEKINGDNNINNNENYYAGNGGTILAVDLYLRIKFYPPNLNRIQDSFVRNYLWLQLRRDLRVGKLTSSPENLTYLMACILQFELGDYDESKLDLIPALNIVPNQDLMEDNAIVIWRTRLFNMKKHQALIQFLRGSIILETYGFDYYPVKEHQLQRAYLLGFNYAGIKTIRNGRIAQHFRWHSISKIASERRMIIIHVQQTDNLRRKQILGFKCLSNEDRELLVSRLTEQKYFFTVDLALFDRSVTQLPGLCPLVANSNSTDNVMLSNWPCQQQQQDLLHCQEGHQAQNFSGPQQNGYHLSSSSSVDAASSGSNFGIHQIATSATSFSFSDSVNQLAEHMSHMGKRPGSAVGHHNLLHHDKHLNHQSGAIRETCDHQVRLGDTLSHEVMGPAFRAARISHNQHIHGTQHEQQEELMVDNSVKTQTFQTEAQRTFDLGHCKGKWSATDTSSGVTSLSSKMQHNALDSQTGLNCVGKTEFASDMATQASRLSGGSADTRVHLGPQLNRSQPHYQHEPDERAAKWASLDHKQDNCGSNSDDATAAAPSSNATNASCLCQSRLNHHGQGCALVSTDFANPAASDSMAGDSSSMSRQCYCSHRFAGSSDASRAQMTDGSGLFHSQPICDGNDENKDSTAKGCDCGESRQRNSLWAELVFKCIKCFPDSRSVGEQLRLLASQVTGGSQPRSIGHVWPRADDVAHSDTDNLDLDRFRQCNLNHRLQHQQQHYRHHYHQSLSQPETRFTSYILAPAIKFSIMMLMANLALKTVDGIFGIIVNIFSYGLQETITDSINSLHD